MQQEIIARHDEAKKVEVNVWPAIGAEVELSSILNISSFKGLYVSFE